ncbi:MAG TPA: hypothetical protein VI524_07760 [Anaerolineales bacterium]|nr:hypothetical protein [Anaerolineales bacterium]
MDGIALIFGLAVIVTLAFVVLVILSIPPGEKKDPGAAADEPASQPARGFKSWIPFIGISLVIGIWTFWGAIFFLAVVWLMRLNPSSNSVLTPGITEKNTARRLYLWLLLSPFVTVPIFLVSVFFLSSSASTNQRVLAALIPLIFLTPLLLGLTSKSVFVFRHSQQSILLMAFRAGLASLAISITAQPADGLGLFLLGNGSLWLFGSIWGRNQVTRGECWLMQRKGEKSASLESQAANLSPLDGELEVMLKSLDAKDKLLAKTKALNAFRSGPPETRRRAVEVLSRLGEVEEF